MSNNKQFPDFFTTRGPIAVNVTPLQFGKRTYYKASLISGQEEHESNPKPYLKPYTDNDDEMLDCADVEDNYDIILTKNGSFFTSFYVPSSLLSYIIGAKGVKLKALQRSTNTTIKIPRMNETGDITITGNTERKVASARTQIAMIVMQRKERMRPTHFIGIPINSEEIKTNLIKFRDEILKNPPSGVTEEVFQDPVKLHLTIAVLKILDEEELNLAKRVLQDCYKEEISKIFQENDEIKIKVQGVEIMNDDASSTRVLYGKILMERPDLTEKVEKMTEKIVSYFCRAGIAKKEYEKVKLHLTLMNSSFRDDNPKLPFDARTILDKYKYCLFGYYILKELHLCIRGTTRIDNGAKKYYDIALAIEL